MPPQTTLAYGRSFHFYKEARNNDYVYLELEDIAYDAGYRRVMIAIPVDVWEVIRGLGGTNLDLVNATDDDLARIVESKVAERMSHYESVRVQAPEQTHVFRFTDAEVFGAADEPRDRQLARGIEYYKTERRRQREIVERIAQHKIIEVNNTTDNQTDP